MPLSVPGPTDFLHYTQWSAILTLVFGAIALLGFLFKWGIRFRLVGAAGLMVVLTIGLFSLSLVPITRSVVPGAGRFSTVYDSGATQVVITIPTPISEENLTATLRQAASDLFSPGRLGRNGERLVIRARTVIHPEAGVSQPLYLGQVKRSLLHRDDDQMEITLLKDNLAKLPPLSSTSPA